MASDIAEQMAGKDDAELLQILLRDKDQYRPEVLEIAAREASSRGLSLEAVEDPPVEVADTAVPSGAREELPGFVFYAAGRVVICPHCSGNRFFQRRALLNTRALTLFELDWLNAGAFALTCVSCSRIEWFARVESRLDQPPPAASSSE